MPCPQLRYSHARSSGPAILPRLWTRTDNCGKTKPTFFFHKQNHNNIVFWWGPLNCIYIHYYSHSHTYRDRVYSFIRFPQSCVEYSIIHYIIIAKTKKTIYFFVINDIGNQMYLHVFFYHHYFYKEFNSIFNQLYFVFVYNTINHKSFIKMLSLVIFYIKWSWWNIICAICL